MRWFTEAYSILPDTVAKEEDSDKRRIDAIMASVPAKTPAARVLEDYRRILTDRIASKKMKLRSVRLGLRPAASLLIATDDAGAKLPTQKAPDQYLRKSPGQKAAVDRLYQPFKQNIWSKSCDENREKKGCQNTTEKT